MNAYERMIKVMRDEASRNSSRYPVKLATMISATECKYGALELDSEDLMIAERLDGKLEEGDVVIITQLSDSIYVIMEKVVEM